MTAKVVTRFAPSPTGFLHIGGARTALFNWLFAKHHGGKMLLRIEDTDRARSTDEAIDAILEGLNWLELDWADEPVYQFSRADRHREVAEQLIDQGLAYRCYCTPEEIAEMREKAREEGRTAAYDGTWRNRDPSEAPDGIDPVIRFKSPEAGETIISDQVQGDVTFQNKDLDDLILLRSDGTPTYMLSVVVDDHDMGITHIIRGDDHLTNAGRQTLIYDALGWDIPTFAHIPLIHGPDGAKLSKRHGALGVEAYRDMGYLPIAMRNYLVRLGWSHGDDEVMSTEQMIEWFGLDAIGRSPARFDFQKLENLNGHYIRNIEESELLKYVQKVLPHIDAALADSLSDDDWKRVSMALPALKERAKTVIELMEGAQFIYAQRPIPLEEKSKKVLKDDALQVLRDLLPDLQSLEEWTAENLEQAIRNYSDQSGLKLGKIAPPLRAALTGTSKSPGIYDVLYVLGRDETIGRIEDQI